MLPQIGEMNTETNLKTGNDNSKQEVLYKHATVFESKSKLQNKAAQGKGKVVFNESLSLAVEEPKKDNSPARKRTIEEEDEDE